ncbi:FHA domain-containing protein [Frateuria aurantia]
MRIEFPHSNREDFLWTGDRLRIGSGVDNDLRLPADAAAESHAVIRVDPLIGLILDVVAGADRVYVNARPVRERAILRFGDILGLGRSRLLLCADRAPEVAERDSLADVETGVIGVRAVAGPLSGKIWSLTRQLRFGADGVALPMPSGEAVVLEFERGPQGVRLLATAMSPRFPVRVNGVAVSLPQLLVAGDQVGLGMHRLVVEAPGLLADRVEAAAQVEKPLPPPEDTAGPRGEVWWLILTAAILALGISLVLWIHR